MPSRFRLGLIVMFLVGTSACDQMNRYFANIPHQCGIPPDQIDSSASYFKLLKPDQSELGAMELETTRARFLKGESSAQILNISPRGCVSLKPNQGILQVYNLSPGLQASLNLSGDSKPGAYHELTLQDPPEVTAALSCPSEGYFVNQQLNLPFIVTSSGSTESLSLRLVVKRDDDSTETEIFSKPYGENLDTWPSALSTKELGEGSYHLRLETRQSLKGWDQFLPTEKPNELCALHVLHQQPGIQGSGPFLAASKVVLKKDEKLPWTPSHTLGQVLVCREARSGDEDELTSASKGCVPQAECRDDQNFQDVQLHRADRSGVFDYFLFAKDRSGTRSDLSCQRLIVSEAKPFLSLSWAESEWNRPTAVMKIPRPGIEAQVGISHQQRADLDIANSLECKADILLDGTNLLPGRNVVCTEGRCKGQSLEQFIPCDAHIRASLDQFFSRQTARPSLLRLHVRANDGSGQYAEVKRGIWIHPQRWTPQLVPLMPTIPDSAQFNRILQASDGKILASFARGIAYRTAIDPKWRLASMPSSFAYQSVEIIPSHNGDVYAIGMGQAVNGINPVEIGRWNGTGFQVIPSHPGMDGCLSQSRAHPIEGFWCATDKNVVHFNGTQWQDIEWPVDNPSSPYPSVCGSWIVAGQNASIAVDPRGAYWTVCRGQELFYRPVGGSWEKMPKEFSEIAAIAIDAKHRLWTLESWFTSPGYAMKIGYFQDGQRIEVPAPDFKAQDYPSFVVGLDGRIMLNDLQWDDEAQSWERINGLDRYWPHTHLKAIYNSQSQLFFKTESGILSWQAGDMVHYPLVWFNMELNYINPRNILALPQHELLVQSAEARGRPYLYRIESQRWNSFGVDAGLFEKNQSPMVSHQWFESDGTSTLFIGNKGIVQGTADGWQLLGPAFDKPFYQAERISDQELLLTDTRGLSILKDQRFTPILEPDQNPHVRDWIIKLEATNEVWAFRPGTRSLWKLVKGVLSAYPLPAQAPVQSDRAKELGNQLVAFAEGNVYYRWDTGHSQWQLTSLAELGCPADAVAIFAVNREEVLCKKADRTWVISDQDSSRPFPLPFQSVDMGPTKVIKLKADDYLVLMGSDGLYRIRGTQQQTLLTWKKDSGFYAIDIKVDRYQRVWMIGQPFGLLMLDLSDD